MWGFDLFERVRFELLGKGQSLVEDMSVSQQAAVKGISNRLWGFSSITWAPRQTLTWPSIGFQAFSRYNHGLLWLLSVVRLSKRWPCIGTFLTSIRINHPLLRSQGFSGGPWPRLEVHPAYQSAFKLMDLTANFNEQGSGAPREKEKLGEVDIPGGRWRVPTSLSSSGVSEWPMFGGSKNSNIWVFFWGDFFIINSLCALFGLVIEWPL